MKNYKLPIINFKSILKESILKLKNLNLIKNFTLSLSNGLKFKIKNSNKGSALVAVLVILTVAILVVTAIMQNVLVDTAMSFDLKKSDESYNNAISGIEEASLRLSRDPSFSGATLSMSDGNVIITVTGENPKNIDVVSRVKDNRYISNMQATANFDSNGVLSLGNVEEAY